MISNPYYTTALSKFYCNNLDSSEVKLVFFFLGGKDILVPISNAGCFIQKTRSY